jgi:DNA-damage-inducible protein D
LRQYGNKASGQGKNGIPEKDNPMERRNASELAANQFRMTQTRDKLLGRVI